jgi:hydrogenase maturation protease
MRTDDAVGMLALTRLTESGKLPGGVRVIEGGTLGLDLLDSLRDISHLLALDAVDAGTEPGTLVRFGVHELDNLPLSKSVHLLGFADLIGALRLMDAAPREIVLLGVQPASTDWGTVLTPAVETGQQQLMGFALMQLEQWLNDLSEIVHKTEECS